ncbi:DUF6452 family protein [Flagellimonas zhangzhouensis]|uniref:Uncharacterized protein n=1 Tax=Flagellimonas zhangzhouensis TaxID=1073328 RepID=A0A1H2Y1I7_9FLAO|nr:DUF6452 family protein [Allomuricauda zhangzhouensis]SDQ94310.1 hypothetical protein SAMN05216294_2940 [Allomuricauda zhangzhouensis]SDW98930.1 hypothetical protein SAMN04487892_2932 [Allomuricauda zhangzhouensis]
MKKIIPVLLIALILSYVSSCEKDDICVDGDTPYLVIGFYDIADTTEFKEVSSLRIKAIDNDSVLDNDSFNDRADSPDSLLVPLRIDNTNTSYQFILDSEDDSETDQETGNIDTLIISYSTREAFVSRACGFVMNYDGINIALPSGSENWIQDIKVVESTVENTNNIHVKIFH